VIALRALDQANNLCYSILMSSRVPCMTPWHDVGGLSEVRARWPSVSFTRALPRFKLRLYVIQKNVLNPSDSPPLGPRHRRAIGFIPPGNPLLLLRVSSSSNTQPYVRQLRCPAWVTLSHSHTRLETGGLSEHTPGGPPSFTNPSLYSLFNAAKSSMFLGLNND
jgi:hypothetical protein